MNLLIYVGKKVYITLINNYNYVGIVQSADKNSITLIDKRGVLVSLPSKSILIIKEVENDKSFNT